VFSVDPVTPPASSVLDITTGTPLDGTFGLQVTGQSGLVSKSAPVSLTVATAVADRPTITAPGIGATNVVLTPLLAWTSSPGADDYAVEIATDAAFTTIVYTATEPLTSHAVTTSLAPGTGYFWRVIANNGCGLALQANASFFTLPGVSACTSPALAIPDGTGVPLIDSQILAVSGTIVDVDVTLDITHLFVGDLQTTLKHGASAMTIPLLDRPGLPAINPEFGCPNDDVDATLDDEASGAAEDACSASPPAIAGNLTPIVPLSGFDGLDSATTWTLTVADVVSSDAGTLNTWCVDITYAAPTLDDTDGDGVPDAIDNCPNAANPDQADPFGDGAGAPCDLDLDLDGLPNDWEAVFGLDPANPGDANLDLDGDGLSNAEEFLLGTDPTDPASPPPAAVIPTLSPLGLIALCALLALSPGLVTRRRRRADAGSAHDG